MGFFSAYATSMVAIMPHILALINIIIRNHIYEMKYLVINKHSNARFHLPFSIDTQPLLCLDAPQELS